MQGGGRRWWESQRRREDSLAALTLPSQVSHDFAINFDPENPECEGKRGDSHSRLAPVVCCTLLYTPGQGTDSTPMGPAPCPLPIQNLSATPWPSSIYPPTNPIWTIQLSYLLRKG